MNLIKPIQCLKLLPVLHDPFMYVQDTMHSARGPALIMKDKEWPDQRCTPLSVHTLQAQ